LPPESCPHGLGAQWIVEPLTCARESRSVRNGPRKFPLSMILTKISLEDARGWKTRDFPLGTIATGWLANPGIRLSLTYEHQLQHRCPMGGGSSRNLRWRPRLTEVWKVAAAPTRNVARVVRHGISGSGARMLTQWVRRKTVHHGVSSTGPARESEGQRL
jgi:hypothetical protein